MSAPMNGIRKSIAAATAMALSAVAPIVYADESQLRAEIAELRAQIAEMRAQMKALAEQGRPPSSTASAPPPAAATATAPAVELAARLDKLEQSAAKAAPRERDTTLFSYGEIGYSRPRHDANDTQADLVRAVIGFGHRFDEKTRVYGEFEWEHAVTSGSDKGEAAVEQLYVERRLTDQFGARSGLVLIPLGFLNESHEPTAYYGVFRNFVETAIIPTTWREGGVALFGNTEAGLNWNGGVTTGFDLSKWDPTSNDGRESPLGSIHQELSLAR